MKSSVVAAEFAASAAFEGLSSNADVVPTLSSETSQIFIPSHPLGVKPSGNQYTAKKNAREAIGNFQSLPDEILANFLEYLDSRTLRHLGSTCRALYAFCYSDDLWKTLFIE